MDFQNDNLQFQTLAGGNLSENRPLYSRDGEYLLFMTTFEIKIYSTISYQFVRKLDGSTAPLIDFEFELRDDNTLLACNNLGEIFSWNWKTGVAGNISRIPSINDKPAVVKNFKLLNVYGKSNLAYAFVCIKILGKPVFCRVFNRENDSFVQTPPDLRLVTSDAKIVVDNKNFPNLVVAQGFYVYFVNYKSWINIRLMNAHRVPITAIEMHPTEECIATGDEEGRIFLWREFYKTDTVKTSLYHWHHTKITSICFTIAGANFYSSGEESTIVKWHVVNSYLRQYMPRTPSEVRHLTVSPDNTKVVASLADNSVQFYGTEKSIIQNLQEFTYIVDENTGMCKYPIGLRLNPRNNTLVLNGRVGSLQFYNTYTKSLLYNLNIVNQNKLCKERDRILYNITVSKAAFNIDWMATGEVFNDEEHLPELRLKFWKYQEESQNYALITNIELPHEGGFKAIEFSNDYQVENLLCATVGEDNVIKMWSLDESNNIYKKGKTWYCVAQASYKDLPVDTISFSQDGSLLAAGYGNTLCIYKSDNLKLKAALTGSNGQDGCVTKVSVKNAEVIKKPVVAERHKKLMLLFTKMLNLNDETLVNELQKSITDTSMQKTKSANILKPFNKQEKETLYKQIIKIHELSLFQKLLLCLKLNISCKVHPKVKADLVEYVRKVIPKTTESKLQLQILRLNPRHRFKAKYRLQQHCKQLQKYGSLGSKVTSSLHSKNNQKTFSTFEPTMAEITHVQFAAGEYAHLVVVCTETRILIWNLLTLRLQAVLKLCVKHLTFDPQTNLVAVVTQHNELHLFQPNVPLPIYQRSKLPILHGIAWIPRRHPKQRSINLDWQAQSTLYFINEDQEIIYLSSSNDQEADVPAPIAFDNVAKESIQYTTFGTYATKSIKEKQTVTHQNGPLVLGNSEKSAIKALIDMSVHTMAPMSLMCENFIKSMVKCNDSKPLHDVKNEEDTLTTRLNGYVNGYGSHSDDEDDNEDGNTTAMTNGFSPSSKAATTKIRQDLMNKTEELKRKHQYSLPSTADDEEDKLRCLANQPIKLNF